MVMTITLLLFYAVASLLAPEVSACNPARDISCPTCFLPQHTSKFLPTCFAEVEKLVY